MVNITFYGVRGSTPCSCDANRRYGGNTSCVAIESPGRDPILLDLGTGLRFFGLTQCRSGGFRGTALVSHLHWDHVQGIPFFAPILAEGAELDVYAPAANDAELRDALDVFMAPPYFPVKITDLAGAFRFMAVEDTTFDVDGASVTVAPVPHVGLTVGFRIEVDGVSIAYVPDHQQPGVGSTEVAPSVIELCRDVDVLIHDAQFDEAEFEQRQTWGHCTVDYAVEVAAQSGAKRLVLFHHDPSHGDDRIDELTVHAAALAAERGVQEVVAAREGLTLAMGESATR